MIRRPPRSTLFPYTTPLPISRRTPPARERAAAPPAPERLPPGGDQGRPQLRGDRRPQRRTATGAVAGGPGGRDRLLRANLGRDRHRQGAGSAEIGRAHV